MSTAARYAKHKLAGVGYRGKAAPPKSRQGGQNDYQMRIVRIFESIKDENDSRQTVKTASNHTRLSVFPRLGDNCRVW